MLDRTNGPRYFLQLLADAIWEVRDRRPSDRLTMADVEAGRDEVDGQIQAFYRGRWRKATEAEQRILTAIAESGREEMTRAEIAAAMGVKSSDIGMARASLLGKGILTAPRHGVLAFNAPGFGAFILEESNG